MSVIGRIFHVLEQAENEDDAGRAVQHVLDTMPGKSRTPVEPAAQRRRGDRHDTIPAAGRSTTLHSLLLQWQRVMEEGRLADGLHHMDRMVAAARDVLPNSSCEATSILPNALQVVFLLFAENWATLPLLEWPRAVNIIRNGICILKEWEKRCIGPTEISAAMVEARLNCNVHFRRYNTYVDSGAVAPRSLTSQHPFQVPMGWFDDPVRCSIKELARVAPAWVKCDVPLTFHHFSDEDRKCRGLMTLFAQWHVFGNCELWTSAWSQTLLDTLHQWYSLEYECPERIVSWAILHCGSDGCIRDVIHCVDPRSGEFVPPHDDQVQHDNQMCEDAPRDVVQRDGAISASPFARLWTCKLNNFADACTLDSFLCRAMFSVESHQTLCAQLASKCADLRDDRLHVAVEMMQQLPMMLASMCTRLPVRHLEWMASHGTELAGKNPDDGNPSEIQFIACLADTMVSSLQHYAFEDVNEGLCFGGFPLWMLRFFSDPFLLLA